MISFCVNHRTTARVYNTTTLATDCLGHFYCTYITFRALEEEKNVIPLIEECCGGKLLLLLGARGAQNGLDVPLQDFFF